MMVLTLDLAIIRYAVVCERWQKLSTGMVPVFGAFVCGWFGRDMGQSVDVGAGTFRDSWRAGWAEADSAKQIAMRDLHHPFKGAANGDCETCGLIQRHHKDRR